MNTLTWTLALGPALNGCKGASQDVGYVCAVPGEDDATLEVFANSDRPCSSDRKGVEYSCEIAVEGTVVTVTTRYVQGRDVNDECGWPITATCSAALAPGTYSMVFDGESTDITTPLAETTCLPDGNTADTGAGGL